MSRIGKLPIILPKKVDISYTKSEIIVKGKFGTLKKKIPDILIITQNERSLNINLKSESRSNRSLYGLYRTLIHNMVIGVSKQFELTLILKGVGYRAAVKGKEIVFHLGYSYLVKIKIPTEILVEIVQNTIINLKSCDKELLGIFASNIRVWRRPEPYKGKGILYLGEQIRRKASKSAK